MERRQTIEKKEWRYCDIKNAIQARIVWWRDVGLSPANRDLRQREGEHRWNFYVFMPKTMKYAKEIDVNHPMSIQAPAHWYWSFAREHVDGIEIGCDYRHLYDGYWQCLEPDAEPPASIVNDMMEAVNWIIRFNNGELEETDE